METTATPALGGEPLHTTRSMTVLFAIGFACIAANAFGLLGPLSPALFPALTLAAFMATIVGVRRYDPEVRWPWYTLAFGFALFFAGGIAREATDSLGVLTVHRSLAPDLITIPGYVLVTVGLFGFAKARIRDTVARIDIALDAGVAALAALTVAWLFLLNPAVFTAENVPLQVRLLVAAYVPLSVFLVASTAGLAFAAGGQQLVADKLRLGAMTFLLIGDVIFMLLETQTVAIPKHIVEVPYALAYLSYIASVLHPSMRAQTEPNPVRRSGATVGRVSVIALALAIPGMASVFRLSAPTRDRLVLGGIVLTLTSLAILRLVRALRSNARSEALLTYQSTHDSLTGLPNRVGLHHEIIERIESARASSSMVAVFLCDIDRFKLINDSYGHNFGDAFLEQVGDRLRAGIRPTDVVARIGGDEFVVVLSHLHVESEALELAHRTQQIFATPFTVHGAEIASSVSVGVAIGDPSDVTTTPEALIRDADIAVYQAKDSGRNTAVVFDASMRDRISHRLAVERDLRHALERHELAVHYQPIVDLTSGRVSGFEALLRWSHPTWGQVAPMSFIPVAEDTGLIIDIGAWVLEQACGQLAEWRATLPRSNRLQMSVNLSACQLRDSAIVEQVRRVLVESGLPQDALTLELTESTLMENPAAAAELLNRLKSLGIGLSIDDFGTGYSSLAYLRRFPVDVVKIDRAFVMDLEDEDTSDATLVAAIVAMAGALGIGTVAEGVETMGQARRLTDLGCDLGQGYLYSRPIEAALIPAAINRIEAEARGRLQAVRTEKSA